jgi:1-acyl-sn-glycerol-3-phosphate acyltransferase
LAKSDYFTGRGLKGRATAAFFKGAGQLSVDRSGGRAGQAAVNSGLKVLRRGDLLGIYPEGTRSPDGRLYRGRTGVARMALHAGCPVLPVAMIGTDKAQPSGKRVPKIMRIGVRIGKPLDFSRYEGMEDDRFVLRSVTDEIMYELMLLSRQEYVDMYATSMKDRLLAAAKAKAKELQQEATDKMEKRDKAKVDGAGPADGGHDQAPGPAAGDKDHPPDDPGQRARG